MRRGTARHFFVIADCSFDMYRELFLKIVAFSILTHMPIYILNYISQKFFIEGDQIVNEALFSLFAVLQFVLLTTFVPILIGYITLKTYEKFTNKLDANIFRPKISFYTIIAKLKSAFGYRVFFAFSVSLCIWTAISLLFSLSFFIVGPRTILQIFPFAELPVTIKFWDAFFSLVLYFGLFIWMLFLCIRWIFGYQGIFIENDKFFDAIKRSFHISKGTIRFIIVSLISFFALQGWLLIAFGILFVGLEVFANLNIGLRLIMFFLTSLFYPLFIILVTMIYIFKKFDKDAIGLELKMLKLMGKDGGRAYDRCVIQILNLEFSLFGEKEEEQYNKAGLLSRFLACLIDFLFAISLVAVFEFIGWFFNIPNGTPNWSTWIDLMEPNYFYTYLIFFYATIVSLAHLILNIIWSLILNGDTPGKKIVGITVVNKDGLKPSKINTFKREVFRLIDFFPVFYILGVVVMSVNGSYRRIGDLIAKTYVVKKDIEKKKEKKLELSNFGSNQPSKIRSFKISKLEREILKEFLERDDLEGGRKEYFESNLSIFFTLKYNIDENYGNPYDMFRDLLEN